AKVPARDDDRVECSAIDANRMHRVQTGGAAVARVVHGPQEQLAAAPGATRLRPRTAPRERPLPAGATPSRGAPARGIAEAARVAGASRAEEEWIVELVLLGGAAVDVGQRLGEGRCR